MELNALEGLRLDLRIIRHNLLVQSEQQRAKHRAVLRGAGVEVEKQGRKQRICGLLIDRIPKRRGKSGELTVGDFARSPQFLAGSCASSSNIPTIFGDCRGEAGEDHAALGAFAPELGLRFILGLHQNPVQSADEGDDDVAMVVESWDAVVHEILKQSLCGFFLHDALEKIREGVLQGLFFVWGVRMPKDGSRGKIHNDG